MTSENAQKKECTKYRSIYRLTSNVYIHTYLLRGPRVILWRNGADDLIVNNINITTQVFFSPQLSKKVPSMLEHPVVVSCSQIKVYFGGGRK